jgi:hypothetical protein
MKRLAVTCSLVAVIVAIVVACDSQQAIITCKNIPDGGCPATGANDCADPTCAAGYTCGIDGGWTLAFVCPPQDGGSGDAIAPEAATDAGYNIDAPPGAFGGPGCVGLQPPDCPLGQVLICSSGCCGCEDLFVCSDGGWDPWGTCTDAGAVPL